MSFLVHPPLSTVFRRRENEGEPVNDRRLRARIDAGEMVRIAPGSFAEARAWAQLTPSARHAQEVWEAAARMRPGQIYSHFAAASLHAIAILGGWPTRIDVAVATTTGGRSSGGVRRLGRDISSIHIQPWGRHFVTTPLQTATDLVAALKFIDGVAVADQALWAKRPGGALVARDPLLAAAHDRAGRGAARAIRAAEFATSLADSVRESQSRVLIAMMGFPAPELQVRFTLADGTHAFPDFFWRDHRHIGEYDGVGKYVDPALLSGRTPQQVLIAEKDREDDLRRQVAAFSRWRTPALSSPRRLFDILTRAGLPATGPRPGR